MNPFIELACCTMLAATSLQPVAAQQGAGGAGHRVQGGGINYAPRPAVYSVVSIDADARTVRLRAADGRTSDVFVPEQTYELDKLTPGDRIRVDFLASSANGRLSAASVWPVR